MRLYACGKSWELAGNTHDQLSSAIVVLLHKTDKWRETRSTWHASSQVFDIYIYMFCIYIRMWEGDEVVPPPITQIRYVQETLPRIPTRSSPSAGNRSPNRFRLECRLWKCNGSLCQQIRDTSNWWSANSSYPRVNIWMTWKEYWIILMLLSLLFCQKWKVHFVKKFSKTRD